MADDLTNSPSGLSRFLAPDATAANDAKLAWVNEAMQEGRNFLESFQGYEDIDRAINIIAGHIVEKIPKSRSRVRINLIKRNLSEIVATLSNIRMLGEFKSDNRLYESQLAVLNKMQQSWYLSTFADREVRKALQWAGVGALGWVTMGWRKDYWTDTRGDIMLRALGPRSVYPNQMSDDWNIQSAYSTTLAIEMSIPRACELYPAYSDVIIASAGAKPSWFRRQLQSVQKFFSPALQAAENDRQGKAARASNFPTVTIFYTYIRDKSVNRSGKEIPMGEPDTNWYYKVPYIGQNLPTGINTAGGEPTFRVARASDCMIYPLRRLMVSVSGGVLYDGTSPYWCAKVPAVPFRLDDWPWDFLGFSLVRDPNSVQESMTEILRAMDDSAKARIDPALVGDENRVSGALMHSIDPRKPGQRVRLQTGIGGDILKPLLGADYYNLPAWIEGHLKTLAEAIPKLMATQDLQALAKARQVPAGDTLEKLMEMAGPITTDKSRNMESSIRDLSDMWKAFAFQFYTLPRRVRDLGPDGAGEHDYDYSPGNMIPSHLPDEYERMADGSMPKGAASRANIVQRARAHINSFHTEVEPHSIHQITQMTSRLMYMQLFIRGFPMDPWTMARAFNIANFGKPPAELEAQLPEGMKGTVLGNWMIWLEIRSKLMGGAEPQAEHRGRKPSGQTPPTMETKPGGRTTMRESPR